jgi:hypothetical protein
VSFIAAFRPVPSTEITSRNAGDLAHLFAEREFDEFSMTVRDGKTRIGLSI